MKTLLYWIVISLLLSKFYIPGGIVGFIIMYVLFSFIETFEPKPKPSDSVPASSEPARLS